MSSPFLGEIRAFGFNFAPQGWSMCNGQLLPINQNQALFALLGTFYGGNGTTNFALPDLRGRASLSQGQGPGLSNYGIGQAIGTETVTLLVGQMPAHNHMWAVNAAAGDTIPPTGNFLAGAVESAGVAQKSYGAAGGATVPLATTTLSTIGADAAHQNMQPFLVVNYCIALSGIFPSRN